MMLDLKYFDPTKHTVKVGDIDLIVGREEECERLRFISNYFNNVLITGKVGYGKTAMLHWAREFAYSNRLCVFVPESEKLRSTYTYYYVLSKSLASALVHEYSKKISPLAFSYAKTILKSFADKYKYTYAFFEGVLETLLNYLESENLLPVYFFIDDANYFSSKSENMMIMRDSFKSLMSVERRYGFIMTMEYKALMKLYNEDPAFLDRFHVRIGLRNLSDEEVKELIRKRLLVARIDYEGDDEWFPFTEDAVDYLAGEVDGVPRKALLLTRIVLEKFLAKHGGIISEDDRINLDFVSRTLRKAGMDTYSGVLQELGDKAVAIYNFIKMKGGSASFEDIMTGTGLSKPTTWRYLKELINLGYVEKKDRGIYSLTLEEL